MTRKKTGQTDAATTSRDQTTPFYRYYEKEMRKLLGTLLTCELYLDQALKLDWPDSPTFSLLAESFPTLEPWMFTPGETDFYCLVDGQIEAVRDDIMRRLTEMVFVQAVSYFELYVSDVVKHGLVSNPQILKGCGIQFEAHQLVDLASREDLLEMTADRAAEKLVDNKTKTLNRLKSCFGLDITTLPVSEARVRYLVTARNALMHNGGYVDEQVAQQFPKATLKDGRMLLGKDEAIEACNELVSLMQAIDTHMAKHYCPAPANFLERLTLVAAAGKRGQKRARSTKKE